MRIPGIHIIKSVCAMLAVLLCCVLTFCFPGNAQAAPAPDVNLEQYTEAEEEAEPVSYVTAGEISPGESEAIIQVKKSLLFPLLQTFLSQLYPPQSALIIKPGEFPYSQGDCGKHSSLPKGP